MTRRPEISAADICALLRAHYSTDQYAVGFEVKDATGFAGSQRRADAVVMNLWPSRGLSLHGYEIKVYRSDWLKELRDPAKCEESIFRFCATWTVITAPGVIADVAELPETWGWTEVVNGQMVTRKAPPALSPIEPDRAFWAAFVRGVGRPGRKEEQALRNQIREEAWSDVKAKVDREVERRLSRMGPDGEDARRLTLLRKMVPDDFVVDDEFAAAVRAVLALGPCGGWQSVQAIRNILQQTERNLAVAMAPVEQAAGAGRKKKGAIA